MASDQSRTALEKIRANKLINFWPAIAPGVPTDAPPGSSEKLRVLATRAAQGEPLFHPDDSDVDYE